MGSINIKNSDNQDTPSLNYTKLYPKENKQFYYKDDTGLETALSCDEFINLTDTPSAYTSQAGKYLKVNSGEDAVEFVSLSVDADGIAMDAIGTPTYTTVKDWSDVTQSAGIISGGTITDAGSGNIDVSEVQGVIKITNSNIGENKFFTLAAVSDQAVTDNNVNYIAVDYNSGTPQLLVSTSNSANGRTIFNLGKVYREGSTVDIINSGVQLQEVTKRLQKYNVEKSELHFVSGARVAETGTRNIIITSGVMYAGLNRIITDGIDTSDGDTFEYYYYNGSTWVESDQTQIDNLYYNDITTGLELVDDKKYGVHWVYKGTGTSAYVIYGQDEYKLDEAVKAQPPASLPPHVEEMGAIVARIIIKGEATTFEDVGNTSDIDFSAGSVNAHNGLTGLQGGTADQYYHLTATEYPYISGANAQSVLTTASPTFAGGTFTGFPTTPSSAPTTNYQVANKKYVDDNGGGSAAGSDTQVQFNDGGTDFGGDSGFTFDKTNNTITITGSTNDGTTDTIVIKDSDDSTVLNIDTNGYLGFPTPSSTDAVIKITSADTGFGFNNAAWPAIVYSGATKFYLNSTDTVINTTKVRMPGSYGSAGTPLLAFGSPGKVGYYVTSTDGSGLGLSTSVDGTQTVEHRKTVVDYKVPVNFISLTTTERDALTPAAGWVIYNETTSKHQGYDGSAWNDFY